MVKLTREDYNLIAEHQGIKKPYNMSTKRLINIPLIGMIVKIKVKNYQK